MTSERERTAGRRGWWQRSQGSRRTAIDAEERAALWVGKDRGQETPEETFFLFGEESCSGVLACCMDMRDPFEAALRKWCPQAGIVYHPFHIISSYGREVVDKVRVAEAKK
ncbi:MAG: transposase, partial [Actinobacteria bacterium]|nr:transposase [Actinomycetota bacterium]